MAVTEEGIPIRTIFVPELTINVTNGMLRNYFREFGAIERVVISPERIHGNEPVNVANPVEFFNQQQIGQRNYYAYVTYVTQHGAETALRNPLHTIQNHVTHVLPAFSWNQSPIDVQEYLTRVRMPNDLEKTIYEDMPRLNDDCFLHILKYLGVLEIIRVTRSHQSFRAAAISHKHIRIEKGGHEMNRMTLMQLRELLRELQFGVNISSLYISSQMFSTEAQRYVCDRLYCYIGPQLRALTMAHFNLSSEHFLRMRSLLVNLEYFDADFSSSFDFDVFNVDWNRLHTLRIRTAGPMDRFLDETDRLPAFPRMTKLLLQCNLVASQTLFERVVNCCPNLIELIVIHISDIFTDLSRINPIAMNRLTDLQQLQRLVLSLTRRHYPHNFTETICQMTNLQYLMIAAVKNRIRDEHIMDEVNQNLIALGTGLPQLKELQLIGVAVASGNILSLIEVAMNLETIAILDSPRFICMPNLIRSIADRRRELFRNAGLPTKQLKIIVDESIFDDIKFSLNGNVPADLVILEHATSFDLYKDFVPPEAVDSMKVLRNQLAVAANAAHQDMAGRRDNFFMRNDNRPFFDRRRNWMEQRGRNIFNMNFPPDDELLFRRQRPNDLNMERHIEVMGRELFDDNSSNSDSD